jgi:hypothetical protein
LFPLRYWWENIERVRQASHHECERYLVADADSHETDYDAEPSQQSPDLPLFYQVIWIQCMTLINSHWR